MTTLIADSGSTKTEWCLIDNASGTTSTFFTQGINPFQMTKETICDVLTTELLANLDTSTLSSIHFYGAGCTPEKSVIVEEALKQSLHFDGIINVNSDMLGAARGLCGTSSGIVCILGTGSNACYYDGTTLHPGNPCLGFILGDEGSGAYIGKRLVGDILKHQMSETLYSQFLEETHETAASIIQKVYREPLPNRYLASLSKFCSAHRNDADIQHLLIDCFTQFFNRNIIGVYDAMTANRTINFVGSIAHYYRSELSIAAEQCGYTIGKIMQAPMEGLIEYHKNGRHPQS